MNKGPRSARQGSCFGFQDFTAIETEAVGNTKMKGIRTGCIQPDDPQCELMG